MADVLTTVLRLTGAGAYVSSLNQAAHAHAILANAQERQARAQAQVSRARAGGRTPSGSALNLAGGAGLGAAGEGMLAAAAIGAVGLAVKQSLESFVEYQRAVVITQQSLSNMGRAVPTSEFTTFARELSLSMGVMETDVVKATGALARFHADAQTTRRALRFLADASIVTGDTMEEGAKKLAEARRGNAGSYYRDLGIMIRGVSGQLYDFNQLMDIGEKRVHGMAGALGQELPGQINRTSAAMQVMRNEVGKTLAPAGGLFQQLAKRWALGMADLAFLLREHRFAPDSMRPTGGPASGATPGAAGLGGPGKPRSEEYLRRIEMNTGPQGALGRALRGGGSYSEAGGGLRIRDLNRLMRHW